MRPSCRIEIASTALLIAAGLAGCGPAEKEPLRYQFKKGDRINYVIDEKSITEAANNANLPPTEFALTLDVAWQVTDVTADGKIAISQTIERIRANQSTLLGKGSYDSDEVRFPTADYERRLAKALRPFVDADVTLILDSRGTLDNVQYSEQLKSDLSQFDAMTADAASILSEQQIRRRIGLCLPALPEQSPTKGQQWDSQLKLVGKGRVIFDQKHTYEGPVAHGGKTMEKITTRSQMTVGDDPATSRMDEQDINCVSYLDRSTGRLVESVFAQNVTVSRILGKDTFTLTTKLDLTMKLVEKEK
jgi:hypothetical protein